MLAYSGTAFAARGLQVPKGTRKEPARLGHYQPCKPSINSVHGEPARPRAVLYAGTELLTSVVNTRLSVSEKIHLLNLCLASAMEFGKMIGSRASSLFAHCTVTDLPRQVRCQVQHKKRRCLPSAVRTAACHASTRSCQLKQASCILSCSLT